MNYKWLNYKQQYIRKTNSLSYKNCYKNTDELKRLTWLRRCKILGPHTRKITRSQNLQRQDIFVFSNFSVFPKVKEVRLLERRMSSAVPLTEMLLVELKEGRTHLTESAGCLLTCMTSHARRTPVGSCCCAWVSSSDRNQQSELSVGGKRDRDCMLIH